jgi:preprotein translocase subunit SecE
MGRSGLMNKTDVQTVWSRADILLVILASVLVVVGMVGFSFLSAQAMIFRVGVLFGGVVLGLVVARFSEPGRRFIGFAREGYEEAKRVTWPSRDETLKTTGVVFLFVGVMALFLFLVDKVVEKALYDWLLGWK